MWNQRLEESNSDFLLIVTGSIWKVSSETMKKKFQDKLLEMTRVVTEGAESNDITKVLCT